MSAEEIIRGLEADNARMTKQIEEVNKILDSRGRRGLWATPAKVNCYTVKMAKEELLRFEELVSQIEKILSSSQEQKEKQP